MLNAGGGWYEMCNGGHLMIIKSASQRLAPRLLVDSHGGYQARCERTRGRAPAKVCGRPPRSTRRCRHGRRWASRRSRSTPTSSMCAGRAGGSWKSTGCSSPLGAYVDNTRGQGRANAAVTGTIAYAGKQALSGGDESWTA